MTQPEPLFEEELPEEEYQETWNNTDEAVEELLWDVSPVELTDHGDMVKEMREFMLGQFESRGIATRDQINTYMEEDDSDFDIDLDDIDINID